MRTTNEERGQENEEVTTTKTTCNLYNYQREGVRDCVYATVSVRRMGGRTESKQTDNNYSGSREATPTGPTKASARSPCTRYAWVTKKKVTEDTPWRKDVRLGDAIKNTDQ